METKKTFRTVNGNTEINTIEKQNYWLKNEEKYIRYIRNWNKLTELKRSQFQKFIMENIPFKMKSISL